MNAVESPVSFRNSPDIPTGSLLKDIINNDQWDDNAVIVFHDGKYFGINGTSSTPTSISQISVASSQQHEQDQKAHTALTGDIKELFQTSLHSDKSTTPDSSLDASLSHFLTTNLKNLTKSSLVSFLQNQGYASADHTTAASSSPFLEDLPLAPAYKSLSPEQQRELDAGKTVVVKNRTTDPELVRLATGRLRGLMPTFTAYKLTEATSNEVANALWNPTNAPYIFPYCEGSFEGMIDYLNDKTVISESTYQFKATVPGFSKELEEDIAFKGIHISHDDESQEVSFENTQATGNVNKVKGHFQAVAHADKTLASLDLFIDLKGMLLPRILPEKAIRSAAKFILRSAIALAEE